MATPQKMQHYMERHRLGPLFEDLMNKVLHDQPDDPLVYVIKLLYKKAGLEIPQELKLGAVRKSSPERIVRRSKSPDLARKSTTQAWASGSAEGLVGKEKGYDKPWLSNSKKVRPKSPEKDVSKSAAHIKVSKNSVRQLSTQEVQKRAKSAGDNVSTSPGNGHLNSFFDDLLQVNCKPLTPRPPDLASPKSSKPLTPRTPVRKSKTTSWNPDTKVASTFDDIWHDSQQEETKHVLKTEAGANVKNAWASIGLGDGDDGLYSSKGYRGPRTRREDDDPLAGELMPSKVRSSSKEEETTVNTSSGHVRGPRYDTRKHQQKLEQLIQDSDKHSTDSGYNDDQDQEEDEAIELLEDAEELKKEGARHIKPSGYKISRILKQRQQDANVKLNINLYTGPMPGDGLEGDNRYSSLPEGSLYESDQEDRPATGMSGYQVSPGDSDVDEEFESVSQVTGPRRPVWNIDDSDGESYKPKPSRTLPEPSRSKGGISENRKMAATAPVRFSDRPYPTQSMESADSFLNPAAAKTWTAGRESNIEGGSMHRSTQESVRSESGGWNIPRYESDTSITEYSTTGKGRRPPPKAY